MNPQDYTNPLDPNQNTDPSVKSWFESIPSTDTPPIETQAPNPSSHKKWILIGGVACVLLIGGVVTFLGFTSSPVATVGACLTNGHYKSLTGVSLEEKLSSKDGFYTQSFDFVPGSSDYAQGTETAADSFIKKVASLYKGHSEETSIIITISSDYNQSNDTEPSAKQRIDKLKRSLQQNDIPEAAIKTVAPTAFSSEGELSEDSEELNVAKAYLSITSSSKCSQ